MTYKEKNLSYWDLLQKGNMVAWLFPIFWILSAIATGLILRNW